ncbi:MFS transporter [Breznakiella homolactica]|uniref:MFS transporter n=1 Tax=Breznakiella homolactica TaxID=2798577 RepID=A0A7T8BBH8_9SPIR|nr:MFS transporter [Breznakiella homolactica]QQO09243.1 MFS transporter [Breznakiella homolactica]
MKPWKANYTALLIAETLAVAGFGISNPITPLFLSEDLGITDPQTLKIWSGIIQSSSSVTLALFAPIWGHLADKYSRRLMLLRAMFLGGVIVALIPLTNAPWQVLILRTIQGCFVGTVSAATVLAAGIAPAAQVALALGLLQTGVSIGNSLGPLFGGVVSDFFGRRIAFLFTSLILVIAGLIVLKWVEDDTRPRPPKGEKVKKGITSDMGIIFASPVLLALMAVSFSIQTSSSIITPILPLFVRELAAGSRYVGSATGIVLGVGAATTALATFLVGKYASRLGYWKTLIFCLAAGCVLSFPQIFVTNITQLTVMRSMAMFFIGGAIPVLNAIIAVTVDRDKQGIVYGFNTSFSNAGAALGPVIGSVTAAVFSFRSVFAVTALILGFSASVTVWRRKKYLKMREEENQDNPVS